MGVGSEGGWTDSAKLRLDGRRIPDAQGLERWKAKGRHKTGLLEPSMLLRCACVGNFVSVCEVWSFLFAHAVSGKSLK